MSQEHPAYNQLYITAWTFLSLVLAAVLLGMFVFGQSLIGAGHIVWDLIRYLASPII